MRADALRAESWAGEPFLRPDDDPDVVLAHGTARRRALDDALAEMAERPHRALDRVEGALRAAARPRAGPLGEAAASRLGNGASPPPGRRARGMLTELIATAAEGRERQRQRARGAGRDDDEPDDDLELEPDGASTRRSTSRCRSPTTPAPIRRYRFRHPTASGKTIAASGFVEAARTEGVLILTHRRLLVDQFRRELTDHGYGSRFHDAVLTSHTAHAQSNPITIQTYAWFARHVDEIDARRVRARDLRRGAHGARREDVGRDPLARASRSTSA